ncbi:MAG: hypothetical protein KC613_18990, partial [Myxococcales bacterium]|nr:hypothetical protein [Myxococcales bacterium]
GNGNLLRRPIYQCPVGSLFFGTDANGAPRCVNVTCPAGQAFRGFDAALNPVCEVDDGITAIPANQCPPGQAVVAIDAAGRTTCGAPRAEPQECDEGQFMVGIDDDGSVMCADAPEGGGGGGAAGQCAPNEVRPKIMYCGNTSRPVQTFVPAGYNFQIVASCDPDAQTQVMFVSRGGGGNAAGRAAAWQAYLQAGGQIVTEYNISDEVFGAIFGAVGQGTRRGSCRDNAMPVVKLTPDDPFWVEHDIPVVAAGDAACGYEVTNFPGITPLGGWAANQVMFAYRDLGEGRLWLLDADWQDNEASWRPQSTQLMNALVTWCMAGQEPDGGNLFEFQGVRNDVNDADLEGWTRCHLSQYGQSNINIANIQQECGRGTKIMYGCRPTGSNTWRVVAQGDRAAVFTPTGNGNATTRNNGVEWYFSDSYSLGFAPEGQPVSRNSCDTTNTGNNDRICWHSSGGNMTGGWRCGNQTGLNGNNGWERAIWYNDADGGGGGDPGNRFTFQGVRENTPDASLEGWEPCHTSLYGATTNGLSASLNANCDGQYIMYGCRPVGAANWTLLAQGERASVFRDTGNGNATTRHNGVEWYFSTSYSIGFAPEGQPVSRNSCDTQGGQGNLRMCWHSNGDRMTSGYRCGNNFLNGNNGWERRIWTSNAGGAGGGRNDTYASCKQAYSAGLRESGVYNLQPPGEALRRVYCDMTTDG